MKELERWKEIEERKRRRRNILIKGLGRDKRDVREEIERLWKEMGVQAEVEEIREINKRKEEERRMVVVKLRDREGKREVMRKKNC